MVESTFHGNFLYQEDDNSDKVNPEDYRHYFMDYNPQKWDFEVIGRWVRYITPDGQLDISLVIQESPQYGFSIDWTQYGRDRFDNSNDLQMVSLSDVSKIQQAICVSGDQIVSLGTFISPEEAWEIVFGFLTNPTQHPTSKSMADLKDLPWPDYPDFEIIPYKCIRRPKPKMNHKRKVLKWKFQGDFLYDVDNESGQIDPEDYRHFFENYSPQIWDFERNGKYLTHIADNGRSYTLIIHESPQYGIVIDWGTHDGNGANVEQMVSVSDQSKLKYVIDLETGYDVLIGTFISPNAAWEIVHDFLKNPTEPPKAKLMMNCQDLPELKWNDYEEISYKCVR